MTALAAPAFSSASLGARSTTITIRRERMETDANFLGRVVACHSWQSGDELELRADGGRLVQADITASADRSQRSTGLQKPTPGLRNAAQHLLIVGHGSLLAVCDGGELRAMEIRAAARCQADESSEAFFDRLAWEIVMPLKARYRSLRARTVTRFDGRRRSTTTVIATLGE